MHREKLSSVGFLPVLLGWIVAVGATSTLILLLSALGLMGAEEMPIGWAVACVAVGFFVGGYLTGTRDIDAPILHGVGIGLMTLVGWFVLNLLAVLFVEGAVPERLSATLAAGLLLLQMAAAVAGAFIADRRAVRGEDLPGEHLT